MATITVRNLPDDVRDALRARGSAHGRSMESEAREILAAAVASGADGEHGSADLVGRIRQLFAGEQWDGVERSDDLPRSPLIDRS